MAAAILNQTEEAAHDLLAGEDEHHPVPVASVLLGQTGETAYVPPAGEVEHYCLHMGIAHAPPAGETELHLVKVAIEVLQPVVAAGGGSLWPP